MLERITDGFMSFDADWNFTYLNREAAKMLERPADELLGKNVWEVFPELAESPFGKFYRETVARKTPGSIEDIYTPFNRWFNVRAYPSESGLSLFVLDVTARKKVEEALRRSEKKLRMITDALPVLISYLDAGHYYRFANKSYYDWFNKTPAQIIGKHLREIIGREAYEAVLPEIETVLSGREISFERWMPYRNAAERFIHVNYIPDFDSKTGKVKGFYALVRDITESKRVEEKLRGSDARLRLALDIAKTSTFEINLETDEVQTDLIGRAIYGWEPDEPLTFSRVQSHFHPDDKEYVMQAVGAALAPDGEDEFEVEQRIIRTDGEIRWIRVRGRAFFEGEGKERRAVRCLGTYIDITDRKRRAVNAEFLAEIGDDFARLTSSAEIMRVTGEKISRHLSVSRVAFAEIDPPGEYLTTLYNRVEEDVIDATGVFDLSDYMTAEYIDELRRGKTTPVNDIAKDPRTAPFAGQYLPFEVHAQINAPYLSDGRWKFMLTVQHRKPYQWRADEVELVRELSGRIWMRLERARTEEKLRQSEERYRNLANAMPQLVWTAEPDGTVDYYNSLARKYDGLIFDEETAAWNWRPMLHEDDLKATEHAWQEAQRTGRYEFEHRVKMADGKFRWHLSRAFAVKDVKTGKILKWFGTATDIDELKQAQTERETLLAREQAAREQAETANRLKDEFLATVSHELRTPLNAILGWATMARDANFDLNAARRAFEVIERSARNQNQIISDILDVSRIITGKLNLDIQPVELVPVIQTAIDTVRPALQAKRINLTTRFEGNYFQMLGDSNRLQQIVWNLLSNAAKFTPEEGEINVLLKSTRSFAEIRITDSGSGISPDFLPYVFERFRQADAGSNRKHGGLGLGLAIVKHLVEMHGGKVFAESAGSGKGSSFIVRLPLKTKPAGRSDESEKRAAQGETAFPGSGSQTGILQGLSILIVDDETDALEIAGLMLSTNGANIIPACSAAEALRKLQENQPDILISDIGMPELDGYDLIREIRDSRNVKISTIPAVALSAYARTEDADKATAAGYQAHLAKPVELPVLIETIRRLVGRN